MLRVQAHQPSQRQNRQKKNDNIAISEHGRSSFTISGRILVNRFLRSIYGSVRRIAPVNCELPKVAESRFEPVMSAGSAKPRAGINETMSVAENKMLIARRSKVVFTGSPNGIGGIAILNFQLIALFMHMINPCTHL